VTTDEPERAPSIPVEDRPADPGPFHTTDLPPTPQRDRAIEAQAWLEAPDELLGLADDLGSAPARYLRRIGPWLLWRAGPPRGADARYWVARADDLSEQFTFALFPDGTGSGVGPSGTTHHRFRSWKEDLRDHD
jgi:hypothetical protein